MKTNLKIRPRIKNKRVASSSKETQEIIEQQKQDALLEGPARRHREDVMHLSISDMQTPPYEAES